MRDKLELTGDVAAPASDETEWEALNDSLPLLRWCIT